MDDPKILPFKRRGNNEANRPPEPPPLDQDTYEFRTYDRSGHEEVTVQTGHLIVTNVNVALLDERSELRWAIPNNDSLKSILRIKKSSDTTSVENFIPEDQLPSEID